MNNTYTYQDKQYISKPYKHNFILHIILLNISTYLFIANRAKPYLNVVLLLYILFLSAYLLRAIFNSKVKNRQLIECDTIWTVDDKTIQINFDAVPYSDHFNIITDNVRNIYWCEDNHSLVIVYKEPEIFSFTIPFVVSIPYIHTQAIFDMLHKLCALTAENINIEQMKLILEHKPETETRK